MIGFIYVVYPFFLKRYKLKLSRKGVKFITILWNNAIEHNGSNK